MYGVFFMCILGLKVLSSIRLSHLSRRRPLYCSVENRSPFFSSRDYQSFPDPIISSPVNPQSIDTQTSSIDDRDIPIDMPSFIRDGEYPFHLLSSSNSETGGSSRSDHGNRSSSGPPLTTNGSQSTGSLLNFPTNQ